MEDMSKMGEIPKVNSKPGGLVSEKTPGAEGVAVDAAKVVHKDGGTPHNFSTSLPSAK